MAAPQHDPLVIQADCLSAHDLMPQLGVTAGDQIETWESPLSWKIRSGRPVVVLGAARATPSVLRQIYALAGLDPLEALGR